MPLVKPETVMKEIIYMRRPLGLVLWVWVLLSMVSYWYSRMTFSLVTGLLCCLFLLVGWNWFFDRSYYDDEE
jgi:hypothetical protein